jgi:hypothetical protein
LGIVGSLSAPDRRDAEAHVVFGAIDKQKRPVRLAVARRAAYRAAARDGVFSSAAR